jgi:KEOPS complex subunit Cgi121
MIILFGAKGTIQDIDLFLQKLLMFSKEKNIIIQALDANLVYSQDHLRSATEHAQRAFMNNTNATKSLALEILLYAAGERQIQKAIKKIGVKQGKHSIAFVLVDERKKTSNRKTYDRVIDELLTIFHLTIDDKVLEGTIDTLTRFGLTKKEICTVPEQKYGDLILEKVAQVDIIK